MITYLALTAGLIARTLVAVSVQLRGRDVLWVAGCVLLGGIMVLRTMEDGDPAWVMLPIGYAMFAVFVFKKYLLQSVTEGMLLLFGLLALYVFLIQNFATYSLWGERFEQTMLLDAGAASGFMLSFLIIYLTVAVSLLLTRVRSSHTLQVFYMILFMITSVWLTYTVSVATLSLSASPWELAAIGFAYLPFMANVFYVLYFIPIPLSKRQSFGDRMREIRAHSHDVAAQYFDIDADWQTAVANVAFAGVFCGAHFFGLISLPLAITLAITCGALINRPPSTPVFTPEAIVGRW